MPSLALQYFVEKSSEFQDAAYASEYADVIARIENYLRGEGYNLDSAGEAVIQILFVDTAHLADKDFYNSLCNNSELRLVHPLAVKDYRPKPIITIGVFDIMDIYEEGPGLGINTKEEDFDWRAKRTADHILYAMHLDHRVKFLDSSIWHRYVPVKPSDGATFENKLKHVLDKMLDYYEQGLYHSVAAVTTLEFNCRMLLNSFIEKAGEKGHHEAVTPFKFHSETVMKKKAEDLLRFLEDEREQSAKLSDLKWNVLMVDDHSDSPLSGISSIDIKKHPSKKEIIEKAVNAEGRLKVAIGDYTSEDKKIITQGIDKLVNNTFDIILLDYLLGESELSSTLKAYGHEFLLEMTTGQKQHQLRRGPMGRFWIYPISSFPHAFTDKLRQLNIDGSNRRWHIANGGDPVSTPELFRVNFYRLLLRQITEYYLHEAALVRWAAQFNGIEDKDVWCTAVELQIDVEKQKIKLMGSYRDGSEFLRSMEDFLEKQKEYHTLWDQLYSWIDMVKKYKKGESPVAILADLKKSASRHSQASAMLSRLESQFLKFAVDAAANLLDQAIETQKGNTDSKEVEFKPKANESLYFFPSEMPHVAPDITKLAITNTSIQSIPNTLGKFSKLEKLDLQRNAQLVHFPAQEVLQGCPHLRYLNLRGTELETKLKAVRQDAFAGTRKDVEALLNALITSVPPAEKINIKYSLNIFISYAHESSQDKSMLVTHLASLTREGLIRILSEDDILPGKDKEKAIEEMVQSARIVVPLIESRYWSDDKNATIIDNILDHQHKSNTQVIPVYLNHIDKGDATVGKLKPLPDGWEKPVMAFDNPDLAWYQVAAGIRRVVENIRNGDQSSPK